LLCFSVLPRKKRGGKDEGKGGGDEKRILFRTDAESGPALSITQPLFAKKRREKKREKFAYKENCGNLVALFWTLFCADRFTKKKKEKGGGGKSEGKRITCPRRDPEKTLTRRKKKEKEGEKENRCSEPATRTVKSQAKVFSSPGEKKGKQRRITGTAVSKERGKKKKKKGGEGGKERSNSPQVYANLILEGKRKGEKKKREEGKTTEKRGGSAAVANIFPHKRQGKRGGAKIEGGTRSPNESPLV